MRGPRAGVRSLRRTGVALLVVLTGACGVAFAQGGLTPVRARITDEAVAADLRLMADWQRRLVAAGPTDTTAPARVYTAAKAEAWLAFARDEYRDNDRGTIVDDAFREATARIAGLEEGVAVVDGPQALPRAVRRVRPDLWNAVVRFKAHPRFARVSGDVARLEVALVRAGHGATPGATCLSAPFLALADTLAARIERALAAPVPAVPLAVTPPPAPRPPLDSDGDGVPDSLDCCPNTPPGVRVDADGCEPLPAENVPLVLDGVTFETARSVLLPGSRAILDRVAASLVARGDVLIEVDGHTDARGGAAYNLGLSASRAAAVRDYLVARGVAADRITSRGYGKDRPRDDNGTVAGRARNRRVELLWHRPARAVVRVACRPVARDTFAVGLPTAAAPAPLVLEGVVFATGSAVLAPASRTVLDRVAAALLAHPEVSVQVAGHTDNLGAPPANRALSLARAAAVRAYLISKGVAADRLEARGYGPDRPRAPNATAEGQALNRRVELRPLALARAEEAAAAAAAAERPVLAPGAEVPVGIGDTVILDALEFQSGRPVLSARHRALLDGVAAWLQRNPNVAIRLWGHADAAEGVGNLVGRSAARVAAVRAYLYSRGVAGARMIDYAFGADRSIAPSTTPEARARNRRVEITRD